MNTQIQPFTPFTPFIPSDGASQKAGLSDKAWQLNTAAAKLAGQIHPITRKTVTNHMAVINSYYSNLIEGNSTRPFEIRAAQRGDFLADPAKRDLQMESLAHIRVQNWIGEQTVDLNQICTTDFIRAIHECLYRDLPPSLCEIKNKEGKVVDTLIPGQLRQRDVEVGVHVAPSFNDVPSLMKSFFDIYHPDRFAGERKVIAVMAAHHRLAWIHPFVDGNGRVARLLTDLLLRAVGLESEGVWCLSRGLAKNIDRYKLALAGADTLRQGDYDGRGALTESGLIAFIDFMLDMALDQVGYMEGLLQLKTMKKRITSYVQARNDHRVQNYGEINPIAAQVLYHAFVEGSIGRGQATTLTNMPERSGRRVITQLREEGLLGEVSPKSELTWEIPEHAEPWYFPQLTPQG